jgi:UDP-N-acetylglucosamine 2-epimerase (non-hydrolysing)
LEGEGISDGDSETISQRGSMPIKVILVAGARPNFMKIAPLWSEMNRLPNDFEPIILHTGQHYDYEMSKVFFEDLDLPEPHYFLGVGSGTHAEQTGKIMVEFESVIRNERPDLVVVFGDVNSTLACSVTAKKLVIPVAHVEAGLRSFDMSMPEEINRKITDTISDILFTPSKDADKNLIQEGVERSKIYFVGNIMIDSLISILKGIDQPYEDKVFHKFGLERNNFVLVTLHRPSNVDSKDILWKIIRFLKVLSLKIPIIFPVHPRTRKIIDAVGTDLLSNGKVQMVEPLRYKEFIALEKYPTFVLTDSGGIQEETTYFHVPCLTLRPNTERPITITQGTNELVSLENAEAKASSILLGNWKQGKTLERWDGNTAKRIVEVLKRTEF